MPEIVVAGTAPWTPPLLLLQGGGEGMFEALFQLAILAVVFGGPILRGILKERSGGARPAPRPQPRPTRSRPDTTGDQAQGKDLWKELLAGAEAKPAEVEEAPPRPARSRIPQDPLVDPAQDPGRSARRDVAPAKKPKRKRLSEALPSAEKGPVLTEAQLEQVGGDQVRPHVPLTELQGLEASTLGAGGAGQPSALGDLAGTQLGRLGASTAVPAGTAPPRGPEPLALGRDDLRRAILMAEVLGPPVALREGSALDPPGLRHDV